MRFLDLAKVIVRSGHGGPGAASFRREKFVEFGGPDGGDGGNGGSVFIKAVPDLNTLIDYRYKRHVIAANGQPGRGKCRHGAKGHDVMMQVPIGTEILDESQTEILFDLITEGEVQLLAPGGSGGFGNRRFLSSTNQAPREANPGQKGLERTVWLRLKLFADIGLLGLPNAGKSTLLATATRARPKVADYPFTTLHPTLGMLIVNHSEYIIADIPGLIEGAHAGRGIGDRFLGHVERCQVLIHLIDASSEDIINDYQTVINEISQYGKSLPEKPRLTFLSKVDLLSEDECATRCKLLADVAGQNVGIMSALSGAGVEPGLRRAAELVDHARQGGAEPVTWTP
ncbi:MAG: GTPase ObgE [Rhodobacteraceae bacterium]|nr:GTPase ObgE [Paracoccaceae bacterium]